MTTTDYQCPKCQGHDLKRLEWPNWIIVHWVLNPGLAFNEVVLGQRLPQLMLTCQSCPGPLLERQFVPCPHCGTVHDGLRWAGQHGFGNWLGMVCPECKKRIPCIWNLTSLVVLALLSPLWYLPYQYYFRDRPGTPPPPRQQLPTAKTVKWWKMGLIFGLIMWVTSLLGGISQTDRISMPLIAGKAVGGLVAGAVFGLLMKFFMNRKSKPR